jgi:4-amino-4-deoxy-L-arabinose transferase-like glycosyltransferase
MKLRQIALALLGLALLRSLLIALIIQPSYGADGAGYLRYIDTLSNPSDRASLWYIRGTTPVYPIFAYTLYLLGSGYTIVLAQIILGGLLAPAFYISLRHFDKRAAILSGFLVAIDPQTGLLFQHVATDALYIALLGLGMAAFFWTIQHQKSIWAALALGLLLGTGSLVRPVGLLLIVPYAFFYILMTRSVWRTGFMTAAYVTVIIMLSLLNLRQFGFFATSNTSGLYLGTRIFSTGDLYSREHGNYSEALYRLAYEPIPLCELRLTNNPDANLELPQQLRLCLYYGHGMSLDEISSLYQRVYGESIRAEPLSYLKSTAAQLLEYLWKFSDPYTRDLAQSQVANCNLESQVWYDDQHMFCPATPTPLDFLSRPLFVGMLAFSLLTRPVIFVLAGFLFWKGRWRWVFLFCLGIYSYHAVITASAGTILPRYVTVTNLYLLVTLSFVVIGVHDWYWQSSARSVKSKQIKQQGD